MSLRHIKTSSHPEFINFDTWISQKIAAAQAQSNTAEVEKIQAALNAKTQSTLGINSVFVAEGITDYTQDHPSVPEFDFYFNQWVQDYNVQISVDYIDDNPGIVSEDPPEAPAP